MCIFIFFNYNSKSRKKTRKRKNTMNYSNITELDLSNKGLTKLPDDIHKYINLKTLNCASNQITSLNNLPPALKELYCECNPLLYDFELTLENIRKYNAKN